MLGLTGRLAAASFGFAMAGAVLSPAPAQAADDAAAQIADLSYDVYVGGLHIFSFDVEMALLPDRYRLTAAGETRGMAAWMYSWKLNLAAEGVVEDGRIAAQRFVSESLRKSKQTKTELGFDANGRYDVEQAPPPEPDPDIEGELPESLPEGTVDPLTFAIAATRALEASGRCDQTVPVFDGQRRFNAVVKQLGPTTLSPNPYSMYQGAAIRCSLEIERISGFRKSLRSKQEEEAPPPMIWLASIRPDLPPVPVRYEGAIKLGKMIVHLTRAQFRIESADAVPN